MAADKKLTLDDVYDLSFRALRGAGAEPHQADPGARSVRAAEADGIRNVGLNYLPIYCGHLKCGKLSGNARPTVAVLAPSALLADAASGFAHTAFEAAEARFVDMAGTQGIAALSITNSYSAGVVAWFVERLAENNLVALGFANSPPLMAAAGGKSPFFGTNPLAYAVPRADGPPVVVDQATSQVAYVRVKDYAAAGKTLPEGWGLDRDGKPTTDPNAVLKGGTMAPAGGTKGALMALLVNILAGGLAGPNFSHQASAFGNNEGPPPGVGQFFIAIDPGRFASADRLGASFGDRMADMLTAMTSDPGARLPGANRSTHRERAARDGVMVPAELIAKLEGYAAG